MCILLALRTGDELVIAANRDEHLDRPWEPPQLLLHDPPVFGARDALAGGTWLAVNLEGVFVVGVTNARLGARPRERSRGSLVLDVAAQRSIGEAVALLGELDLERHGAFNLLVAGPAAMWAATNTPDPAVNRVDGPDAALGNDALSSPSRRVEAALERARNAATHDSPLDALAGVLADHEGPDPLCRHFGRYGTTCSTLLRLGVEGVRGHRFAPGPPCVTAFEDVVVPGFPAPRPS
ncbi:MAG: NRDE family protein [Acidobacteriota bacterium]